MHLSDEGDTPSSPRLKLKLTTPGDSSTPKTVLFNDTLVYQDIEDQLRTGLRLAKGLTAYPETIVYETPFLKTYIGWDGQMQLQGRSDTSSPFKITTNSPLLLKDGLQAENLLLKLKDANLAVEGSVKVKNFEIWAGENGSSLSPSESQDSSLIVKKLRLHKGVLKNKLNLKIKNEGAIDLGGNTFLNKQACLLGEKARILSSPGGLLKNRGLIKGTDYSIFSQDFINYKDIIGNTVRLFVDNFMHNYGTLQGDRSLSVTGAGVYHHFAGKLSSPDIFFNTSSFDNYTTITLNAGQVLTFGYNIADWCNHAGASIVAPIVRFQPYGERLLNLCTQNAHNVDDLVSEALLGRYQGAPIPICSNVNVAHENPVPGIKGIINQGHMKIRDFQNQNLFFTNDHDFDCENFSSNGESFLNTKNAILKVMKAADMAGVKFHNAGKVLFEGPICSRLGVFLNQGLMVMRGALDFKGYKFDLWDGQFHSEGPATIDCSMLRSRFDTFFQELILKGNAIVSILGKFTIADGAKSLLSSISYLSNLGKFIIHGLSDVGVKTLKTYAKSEFSLTGKLRASDQIDNKGTITSPADLAVFTPDCDNNTGELHVAGIASLETNKFSNESGSFSGIQGTSLTLNTPPQAVSRWGRGQETIPFNNKAGTFGAKGQTIITYEPVNPIVQLGTILGDEVLFKILPVQHWRYKGTILKNGIVVASQQVTIPGELVECPKVDFRTPRLNLSARRGFILADQTQCERTILTPEGDNRYLKLSNVFRTTGTFEIHEPGIANEAAAQQNPSPQTDLYRCPQIDIHTTIQADGGMKIFSPGSKVSLGRAPFLKMGKDGEWLPEKGTEKKGELLLKGRLDAYVRQFDIINGGISATGLKIVAPIGTTIGRLIEDPTRDLLVKFKPPVVLGVGHIVGDVGYSLGYQGKHYKNVYNAKRHTVRSALSISDGSGVLIKGLMEIFGPFNNLGNIEVYDLRLHLPENGICVASSTTVKNNLHLDGPGKLHLRRESGLVRYNASSFIFGPGHRGGTPTTVSVHNYYAGSDPAKLFVFGGVTHDATSGIINEASQLYVAKQSSISVTEKHLTTPYPQRFVIKNAPFHLFREWQQEFRAVSSFPEGVQIQTTSIQGYFSTPRLLVSLSDDGLVLGSLKPTFIPPQSPICDLTAEAFNTFSTTIMTDIYRMVGPARTTRNPQITFQDPTLSRFHFLMRPRFWSDDEADQEFCQSIVEDVVVVTPSGSFKKADRPRFFNLSPAYLIERVQKQCMDVLMRGYIEDGKLIDKAYVQQLHRNAMDYLRTRHPTDPALKGVLALRGGVLPEAEKPMVFYLEIGEMLKPFLYIPPSLIDEVRRQRGGHIRIKTLCVLPDNVRPQQIVKMFEGRRAIQEHVSTVLAPELLDTRAIVPQTTLAPSRGSVTLEGYLNLGNACIMPAGPLINHADVEGDNLLLVSLEHDVVMKSQVARAGNQENFHDYIPFTVRAAGKDKLAIVSARDTILEGVRTESGRGGTHVEAGQNICDIPVRLVQQSVTHFRHKKRRGEIRATTTTCVPSKHTSEGNYVQYSGGKTMLGASEYHTEGIIDVQANGPLVAVEVHNSREIDATETKKGGFLGHSKTTRTFFMDVQPIGPIFDGKGGTILGSHTGNASLQFPAFLSPLTLLNAPEGEVTIGLGKKSTALSVTKLSKDALWCRNGQTHDVDHTYAIPRIPGRVEVNAKNLILQSVRGVHLDYLDRIDMKSGGRITHQVLDETHTHTRRIKQGPGVGLSALLNAAVMIVTDGMIANPALSAGFSSLCSQACISLLSNEGNPVKALKSMMNEKTAKSLAVAMLSAEAIDRASKALKLPTKFVTKTLSQHIQGALVHSSISSVLNMAILGEDPKTALTQGLTQAAASIVGGYGANQISGVQNPVFHTVLHTGLGGLGGAILSPKDPLKGALSGGLAGLAERIAEGLTDERVKLSDADRKRNANWGCLGAATASLFLNLDVGITISTSRTALDNNYRTSGRDPFTVASRSIVDEDDPDDYEDTPEGVVEGNEDPFTFTMRSVADEDVSPLDPLREALGELAEAIEDERTSRDNPDMSLWQKAVSFVRQSGLEVRYSEWGSALEVRQGPQNVADYFSGGSVDGITALASGINTLTSVVFLASDGGGRRVPTGRTFKTVRQKIQNLKIRYRLMANKPRKDFIPFFHKKFDQRLQIARYSQVRSFGPFNSLPAQPYQPHLIDRPTFYKVAAGFKYTPNGPYVFHAVGNGDTVLLTTTSGTYPANHRVVWKLIQNDPKLQKGASLMGFLEGIEPVFFQNLSNKSGRPVQFAKDQIHTDGRNVWVKNGRLYTLYPGRGEERTQREQVRTLLGKASPALTDFLKRECGAGKIPTVNTLKSLTKRTGNLNKPSVAPKTNKPKKDFIPFVNDPKVGVWEKARFSELRCLKPLVEQPTILRASSYWDRVSNGPWVVDVHGTPYGVEVTDIVRSNTRPIQIERTSIVDHRILTKILQSKGLKKGTPVALLGCSTGKKKNGFAQNFANKSKSPTQAPSTTLWTYWDGKIVISPRIFAWMKKPNTLWKGEFRTFSPKKCKMAVDRTEKILTTVSMGLTGIGLAEIGYGLYRFEDDIATYAPNFYNFMSSPPSSYAEHDLFDPTDTDLFDYTHSDLDYPYDPSPLLSILSGGVTYEDNLPPPPHPSMPDYPRAFPK